MIFLFEEEILWILLEHVVDQKSPHLAVWLSLIFQRFIGLWLKNGN